MLDSSMDESINSSQEDGGKRHNVSIHKLRERRIQKRRNLNMMQTVPNGLDALYHSPKEEIAKSVSVKEEGSSDSEFCPFGDLRLLVEANMETQKSPTKHTQNNLQRHSNGFQKSNELPTVRTSPKPLSSRLSIADPESPLEISETELLEVCQLAERQMSTLEANVPSPTTSTTVGPIVNETPPQKENSKKSIVDIILDDFCSSPSYSQSPAQINPNDSDTTPVYQFMHKNAKTYQCKRRPGNLQPQNAKKPKIVQQLEQRFGQDDDCYSSSSSSSSCLSEQEDLTQRLITPCTINLNNSQQLTDNLISLSTFFRHKSNDCITSPPPKDECSLNVNDDAVGLDDTLMSAVEFTAFDSSPTTSSSTRSTASKQGTPTTDRKSSIDLNDWGDEDDNFLRNIQTENILELLNEKETSPKVQKEEPSKNENECLCANEIESLLNIPFSEWGYDDDEYDEKSSPKAVEPLNTTTFECIGFKTARKKSIEVSEEAKVKAARLLEDLPEIAMPNSVLNNENVIDTKTAIMVNEMLDEVTSTISFKTASRKSIQVSEVAKLKANKLLDDLLQDNNLDDFSSDCTDKLNEMTTFVGFQTAAKKTINVSEKAKEKAAKMLENLPEIPLKNHNTNIEMTVRKEFADSKTTKSPNPLFKDDAGNSSITIGFQTASRKSIQVSEAAKLKANRILDDLLPDESKNQHNEIKNDINWNALPIELNEIPEFVGFKTAAKKTIHISEEAKEKATKMLENLPEISFKTPSEPKANMDLDNISENVKTSETESTSSDTVTQIPLAISVSKMRANSLDLMPNSITTHVDNDATANRQLENETPIETPIRKGTKILCRSLSSNDLEQRKPFNSINNCDNLGIMPTSSFSCSNAVISRKNLLSLTKRRKTKSALSQSPFVRTTNGIAITMRSRSSANYNETPMKALQLNETVMSPVTPCLKDFLRSVDSTSTPKNTAAIVNASSTKIADHVDESGLQRILWTDSNDATTTFVTTKERQQDQTPETLNKTCISTKRLTPKERIAKLSSFGKAPSISPVAMLSESSCRPSGLRRRSGRLLSNQHKS